MATGFFGGLAEGISSGLQRNQTNDYNQKLLQIEQQRLKNQQQRQLHTEATENNNTLLTAASQYIKEAKLANPNISPKELQQHVQGMVDMLEQSTSALGLPRGYYQSQVTAAIAAPSEAARAELEKTKAETAKTTASTRVLNQAVENNATADPNNPDLDKATQLGGEQKGDNFLHSLPGARGLNAKGLYDGTTPITAFSTRTGKNNTKSQRQQAVEDAETYGLLVGKPFDINRAANLKISETAGTKADASALTQLTQTKQALSAFEDTATENTKVLLDLAKKVPDTGSPLLNRPIRALAKDALGNSDVSAFNFQLQSVKNELSRIITNPRLVGQLTDNARSEINAALDNGATVGMILKAYQTAKKDFQNRSAGLDKSIGEVKDRLSGKSETKKPDHVFNPDTGELE